MLRLHGCEAGRSRRLRRGKGGFSLIELMITLAVLAIALAVGIPSFQGMIQRNRVVAAANELVAALQTARVEAVRRNRRVTLCPSADGAACAGSDWSRLIVFVDANANGAADVGEEMVRDVMVGAANLVIQGSSKVSATGGNRIWFNADGLVRIGANNRMGGISVCSARLPANENTRDVLMAVSRISVATRGAAACAALQD